MMEFCNIFYDLFYDIRQDKQKQFESLQAITNLQEDMLGTCNSLVNYQVDLVGEFSNRGIVTNEQIIPLIEAANKIIESYLNYLSIEYDLELARIRFNHKILTFINDSSSKLTQLHMGFLQLSKISN